MTISKTIQSLVIAAFGMLFISQAQAVPFKLNYENPSNCKHTFVTGVGVHQAASSAYFAALSAWQNSAKIKFGSAYAKYSRAIKRNGKGGCSRNPKTDIYRCALRGWPCRLPVFKR